jgi:hypothetical protein
MEESMEIGDKNFHIKKTNETASIGKKNAPGQKEKSGVEKEIFSVSKESIRKTMDLVQREITEKQLALTGLMTIQSGIRKDADPGANEAFAEEVINKTRFENNRVLESYKPVIDEALENRDPSGMDSLIDGVNTKISSLFTEIEKSEITVQNYQALSNLKEAKTPDELLSSVISSMKKEKIPLLFLERERILDLLG